MISTNFKLFWLPLLLLFWILLPSDLSAESDLRKLTHGFVSGDIAKDKMYDADYLEKILASSNTNVFTQILASSMDVSSPVEFIIHREIWKTLAKIDKSKAAISYAKYLAIAPSEKVKLLHDLAASSDYSERSERQWDFEHYRPILEATKNVPFERLIAYMLEQSPGDALKQLVAVHGNDLTDKQQEEIIETGLQISDYIQKNGILFELRTSIDDPFEEGSMGQKSLDFFLTLKSLDKWYLDLFIVAALKKARASNVSPELNEHINSKPESLANKLRLSKGLFLPPQNLTLVPLKNDKKAIPQNSQRENKLNRSVYQKPSNQSNPKNKVLNDVDEVKQFNLPWIIIGTLIVVIMFLLLRLFKGKSATRI